MRTKQEGIIIDVKKFFADLFAMNRTPTEPPPLAPVVDVGAAHEASRKVGYEAGHAEGYEAGYKKGYDEGFQIALEAKAPHEPPSPSERPLQPEPPAEEPPLS